MTTKFEVNGKAVEVDVEPRMSLADCLRQLLDGDVFPEPHVDVALHGLGVP